MILQRLVEYYDRISCDPASASRLAKPGYSLQKISFCVVLTPDGRLQQFQSLLDAGPKKPLPRQLLVPGQSKPSGSRLNPCFLWDNAAYMLGFKPDDPKPKRTLESFEAFRTKHLSVEKEVKSTAFSAVCTFLRNWAPELAARHAKELKDIVGSFGVFKVAGQERFVHDDPAIMAWRLSRSTENANGAVRGFCLVTGKEEPIARLHEPKIKGVRDAQSPGALLVSFNEEAYESLGKEQSYNAPVSASAAFKYTNALNYLLDPKNHRRVFLGDATVVFWAERPTPIEDFMSDLFSDSPPPADHAPAEDKRRADQVRLFLSQLRQGHAYSSGLEGATRFYVLGLAPNAARISVRFWADTTVAEMEARLRQHMENLDLVASRDSEFLLGINGIVRATGRAESDRRGRLTSYDNGSVSPLLAGAIARAVLTGGPYPEALLSAMVRRIRSDGAISHARVAAIKACLVRNSRLKGNPKEVPVALDIRRSDPAYVSGRLFALLEKIQRDSVEGELNATIKDRYFSSASATPGVVFPRLIRLSQHHLAKMEGGRKVYYEKQLGEVMNKLDAFPAHLNLEEQGLFAVGYFHQRQDLFTKKDRKQTEGESE